MDSSQLKQRFFEFFTDEFMGYIHLRESMNIADYDIAFEAEQRKSVYLQKQKANKKRLAH